MYRFNLLVTREPNSQQDNISFTPLSACLFGCLCQFHFIYNQNKSYNKNSNFACKYIMNECLNEWILERMNEFETCCGAEK